ncbi:glycosyltransferase family A protein [Atopobium sp. oral taxon 810]|uniref:glycosyltransferase family 2 protein n=1 Tax=Atopobium sp. oral taxon 810 TaxID=712158 RepID=UPI000396BFEC|nr:glycosyltransferase family A protein [Atopobium sp. oral taxon 810]ERI04977.1 glycosyltransferase, group 2 family protein [Atopobium sp. oral taxon 810 str. F0209]
MSRLFDKPLVSIVMPAHNVDGTIRRAVESLQRQTCESFELLAIDLNSDDRTSDMLERMADRDIRITILHQSDDDSQLALNCALDQLSGKYLMFVSGNDWLEPPALEELLNTMKQGNPELALSSYYLDSYFGQSEYVSKQRSCTEEDFDTQADFRAAAWRLFEEGQLHDLWGKLFKLDRVKQLGIHFRKQSPDGQCFVLDYLRDIERVATLTHPSYHHCINGNNVYRSQWEDDLYQQLQDEHKELLELYHHWGLDGDPASIEVIQRRYIEGLLGLIRRLCDSSCKMPAAEKRKLVRQMISDDDVQLAARMARPEGRLVSMMLTPIRTRNIALVMAGGSFGAHIMHHNAKSSLRKKK